MLEKVGKLRRSAFLLAWSYLGDYLNWRACSTPCGITEVGTESGRAGRRTHSRVLNALRHHRGRHRRIRQTTAPADGAQRLTASQRSAPLRAGRRIERGRQCSTPYGITEVGTTAACAPVAGRLVCSTPYGITEVGTRSTSSRIRAVQHVLNALRHHRGRHATIAGRRRASPRVLNALRHHRGRHCVLGTPVRRSRWCSTPYGITEVGTPSPGPPRTPHDVCSTPYGITEVGTRSPAVAQRAARRVLNALRHHRGRHSGHRRPARPAHAMCSTPYGITEVGTIAAPRLRTAAVPGAQRLTASQRSARAACVSLRGLRLRAQRLTASQRSARRAEPVPASAGSGAQRLTASQRSALQSGDP